MALALVAIISVVATVLGMLQDSAREISLDVDGSLTTLQASSDQTVATALKAQGVDLEDAVVAPDPDSKISGVSAITVRYWRHIKARVDGELLEGRVLSPTAQEALVSLGRPVASDSYSSYPLEKPFPEEAEEEELVVSQPKLIKLATPEGIEAHQSTAPTVGSFLEEQGVDVNDDVETNVKLQAYTKPEMTVKLTSLAVREKTTQITEELPPVFKDDPDLLEGETKVLHPGSPSTLTKVVEVVYADGEVRSSRVVRTEQVSRGSARVVLRGTRDPFEPSGGDCGGWGTAINRYFGAEASRACQVMLCESGGNPRAENPHSTASGLFQFIDGTWASARTAVGGEKYARAKDAPGDMQIEAAALWLERTSWSQWVCAG